MQWGQSDDSSFYKQEFLGLEPSSWNVFPTEENPLGRFKYISFDIYFSQDLTIWNRQTYSFLDYLGDLGGLYDAIYFICWAFARPLA